VERQSGNVTRHRGAPENAKPDPSRKKKEDAGGVEAERGSAFPEPQTYIKKIGRRGGEGEALVWGAANH